MFNTTYRAVGSHIGGWNNSNVVPEIYHKLESGKLAVAAMPEIYCRFCMGWGCDIDILFNFDFILQPISMKFAGIVAPARLHNII